MISVALVKNMQKDHPALKSLDIPDTVKDNLQYNLKPYLHAVNLSGIEKNTIRKMMIVGNTGI